VAVLRFAAARLSDDPGIGVRASLSNSGSPAGDVVSRVRGQIERAVAGYTDQAPRELVPPTSMALDLTDKERDLGLKEGLVLTRDLSLENQIRAIRVFLIDRHSGASGSLAIPIAADPRRLF